MKNDTIKKIGLWTVIILAAIIVVRIGISLEKSRKKPSDVIFSVNTVKLAKQNITRVMSIQGIVEGDPQVKVYPQVPGKFARNNVSEGQMVNRDDVITYIDRDIVGASYELAPVKAPVSGMVTKLYYIDRGDSVSPQMPVAEIANQDSIKVVFNVGQDDLLKLKKGDRVVISYINDSAISMEGEVVSVPPVVDKDIMAGTVVVKAPNKGRTMKIGMSVNVDISYSQGTAFMVPEKAVLLGDQRSYVYVNKSGTAQSVDVNLDYRLNDTIEITGALAEGDEVITDGSYKLYDGAKVSTAAFEPKEKK
ncbi:MAG: efflux RND transporter periplasmic adaptor subunit [Spirochaetia bacterium]|nr:efflux RND transporter periplasmic adaptor subunit [Spirochaetia bacterium]